MSALTENQPIKSSAEQQPISDMTENQPKGGLLSDSEILRLANDKTFSGSFSGVRTLQKMLFLQFHQKIPMQRLYNIMKKSPDYLMNLRPVRQFTRRHYRVYSFGQLLGKFPFLRNYTSAVCIRVASAWHFN